MDVGDVVICRKMPTLILRKDKKEYLVLMKDKTKAWVPRKALSRCKQEKTNKE